MRWTVRESPEHCGGCGRPIPAGEPFARLTHVRLVRCRLCAGAPVDDAQVAEARALIATRRERPMLMRSRIHPMGAPITVEHVSIDTRRGRLTYRLPKPLVFHSPGELVIEATESAILDVRKDPPDPPPAPEPVDRKLASAGD